MKIRKKTFVSLMLAMMLVITAALPVNQVSAQAAAKTRKYTVNGISFKVPIKYKPDKSTNSSDMKLFSDPDADPAAGRTSMIYVVAIPNGGATASYFKNLDKEDFKSMIESGANKSSGYEGSVENIKRKKVGRYQAVQFDYVVTISGINVTERAFVVNNTSKKKFVLFMGVGTMDDGQAVKDMSGIIKSAKAVKKK